jgi:periplasmic copper chaperone A
MGRGPPAPGGGGAAARHPVKGLQLAAVAAFAACSRTNATRAGPLEIHGAFAFAPVTQDEAAVYLTVVNHGPTADTLVDVQTPYAKGAVLHEESAAGMTMLERAAVGPRDSLHLAPGGLHLMLTSLDRLPRPGERIPLTLRFARAGEVVLEVPVRSYSQ